MTGVQTCALPIFEHVARSTYCHFRSTYLQIAFIRLRKCKDHKSRQRILEIIDEEIQLARELHDIMRMDSRIGFEATNHYYYTMGDLREKVLNCEYLGQSFL